MLKNLIISLILVFSLLSLTPATQAQVGPFPAVFVPVVVGWAVRAGGRVVPIVRMVRAAPPVARQVPSRQAPIRQVPYRSPAEQARRAETQRKLDRAGNALDFVDALDKVINNPVNTRSQEYDRYLDSQRRLNIARNKEHQLDRLARTVHPDSINADRIYRQAAEASRERARVQAEVQIRGERYNASPRGNVPNAREWVRNSDGVNRQAKGDSWADRQRDTPNSRGTTGQGGSGGRGGNSPSIFDNRREKDIKREMSAPRLDKSAFDPKPGGGKLSEFSKEKRQPRDTFTKN